VVWLAGGSSDEHCETVSIEHIQHDLKKNTLEFDWHSGQSTLQSSHWELALHKPSYTSGAHPHGVQRPSRKLDARITHFNRATDEEFDELDSYTGVSQREAEKLICDIASFVAKTRADDSKDRQEARYKTLQAKLDRLQEQHDILQKQHSLCTQQVHAPTPTPAISHPDFHARVKNMAQKRYALLFGTNYANNSELRLSKCVQDVYDMKEKLHASCGFEVAVFAEGLATLTNMKACIQFYVKQLNEEVAELDKLGDNNGPDAPVVMIYFSGHGCEIDGHPAILPYDFEEAGALSLSSILTELQKRKSRK
jgi:hypothetical protein